MKEGNASVAQSVESNRLSVSQSLHRISSCISWQTFRIASCPKMCVWWRQFGHSNTLMFSTSPRTGTFTCLNISTPRRASSRARSWGVETITAPQIQERKRMQSMRRKHKKYNERKNWCRHCLRLNNFRQCISHDWLIDWLIVRLHN